MYYEDACRCRPCRDANSAKARSTRRLKAYGRARVRVDIGPAREHLQKIYALGIRSRRISNMAGMHQSQILKILGTGGQTSQKYVYSDTAERILSLPLDPNVYPDGRGLPAIGYKRRVQALMAIGYSADRQEKLCGVSEGQLDRLRHGNILVTEDMARRIRDMYEKYWDKPYRPNPDDKYDRIARTRAMNLAKRNGWPPPMGWDDIDDPNCEPYVEDGGKRPVGSGRGRVIDEGVLEDLDWLRRSGVLPEDAAERVGFSLKSLRNAVNYRGYPKDSQMAIWLRDEEHKGKGGRRNAA
jgi:hypothetical protein